MRDDTDDERCGKGCKLVSEKIEADDKASIFLTKNILTKKQI